MLPVIVTSVGALSLASISGTSNASIIENFHHSTVDVKLSEVSLTSPSRYCPFTDLTGSDYPRISRLELARIKSIQVRAGQDLGRIKIEHLDSLQIAQLERDSTNLRDARYELSAVVKVRLTGIVDEFKDKILKLLADSKSRANSGACGQLWFNPSKLSIQKRGSIGIDVFQDLDLIVLLCAGERKYLISHERMRLQISVEFLEADPFAQSKNRLEIKTTYGRINRHTQNWISPLQDVDVQPIHFDQGPIPLMLDDIGAIEIYDSGVLDSTHLGIRPPWESKEEIVWWFSGKHPVPIRAGTACFYLREIVLEPGFTLSRRSVRELAEALFNSSPANAADPEFILEEWIDVLLEGNPFGTDYRDLSAVDFRDLIEEHTARSWRRVHKLARDAEQFSEQISKLLRNMDRFGTLPELLVLFGDREFCGLLWDALYTPPTPPVLHPNWHYVWSWPRQIQHIKEIASLEYRRRNEAIFRFKKAVYFRGTWQRLTEEEIAERCKDSLDSNQLSVANHLLDWDERLHWNLYFMESTNLLSYPNPAIVEQRDSILKSLRRLSDYHRLWVRELHQVTVPMRVLQNIITSRDGTLRELLEEGEQERLRKALEEAIGPREPRFPTILDRHRIRKSDGQ